MLRMLLLTMPVLSLCAGPAAADPAVVEPLSRTVSGASLRVAGLCAAHVVIRPDPDARAIAVTAHAAAQAELDAVRITGGRVAAVTHDGACPATPPTLAVDIAVPPGLAVAVAGAGAGDYRIGAVGPLDARFSGSAQLAVEGAAGLRLVMSGSGHAAIDHASGRAKLSVSGSGEVIVQRAEFTETEVALTGSGSIAIKAGNVGALRIDAAGSGRVRIDGAASAATLTASGSSLVFLLHDTGPLRQRPSGGAAITVGP